MTSTMKAAQQAPVIAPPAEVIYSYNITAADVLITQYQQHPKLIYMKAADPAQFTERLWALMAVLVIPDGRPLGLVRASVLSVSPDF